LSNQNVEETLDALRERYAGLNEIERANTYAASIDRLTEIAYGPDCQFVVGVQTPAAVDSNLPACEIVTNLNNWHSVQHAVADMATRVTEVSGESVIVNETADETPAPGVTSDEIEAMGEFGRTWLAGLLGVPVESIHFEGAHEITGEEKAELLRELGL
jgi:hypothetical protein